MSETNEAQAQRDRRSSSVLLSAFRSLTTSRKPSSISPPLSVTASSSSTQIAKRESVDVSSTSDSAHTESTIVAEHPAPVVKEDVHAQEDIHVQENNVLKASDVHGASPELVRLLSQLEMDMPLAVRTQAAYKICKYLEKHPVNEVLAIWILGRDLLSNESTDAVQYGLELLISCIKASELSTTERKLFWESLYNDRKTDHLALRLVALTEVSENGRHIECMEAELSSYLSRLLRTAYVTAVALRKKQPRNSLDLKSASEHMLQQIFDLTTNVIKFNATTLDDSHFGTIIARLYSICSTTSTARDMSNCLDVISNLAIFTTISATCFQPCLDLLCGIYKQVQVLKEATWTVWQRIFESNLRSSAIMYLFSILRSVAEKRKKEMTVQGAFHVLKELAINDGKDGLPNVELANFIPVVNALLKSDANLHLELDVLEFYKTILAEPAFRERLIEDVDWMYFRESLARCATILHENEQRFSFSGPLGSPQTPRSKVGESDTALSRKLLNNIVQYLCDCFDELNIIHQEETAALFLHLGKSLDDNAALILLAHLASRPLIASRPTQDYYTIWRHLIVHYAQDVNRPASIRLRTYQDLSARFDEIQYLPETHLEDYVLLMIQDLDKENDPEVLETIAAFVAKILSSEHRSVLFDKVINKVRGAIFYRQAITSPTQSRRPSTSPTTVGNPAPSISSCRIVVRHIIRLFLELINEAAEESEELYQLIIDVAGEGSLEADARICALKLLFRLRSTEDFRLYVAAHSESESIAEVLSRTMETVSKHMLEDVLEPLKEFRSISTGSVPITKSKPINSRKPVPPLWLYPGPKALPSQPPKEPSLVLRVGPGPTSVQGKKVVVLRIAHWLEMVLTMLQQPNVDWEVYSYVLVHLGSQLKNQSFFVMAIPHIKMLRAVLCDQLRNQTFLEPPAQTSLRKADVAICMYHCLTMLVSYNSHYGKNEEDELVRTFLLGIAFWEGTSKWCIHALAVCCHELPLSVKKSLENIVQKMSTIITRPGIAIHILEFLCGVARLPDMYKNFTEDEYKTVFGVAFKYLQFVQDQQQNQHRMSGRGSSLSKPKRISDGTRDLKHQSSDGNLRSKSTSGEDLPQYVHALAYHVITFWFMALKLRDRPQYVQQIVKNLTFRDNQGREAIEEQGLVTLDMIERVAYTDRDETIEELNFATESDGEVLEKTWIVGLSLLTIRTAGRTGVSQIVRRRPSGTHFSIYRPSLTSPPRHQVPLTNGLEADVFYTSSYTGVLPENVMQDLYAPLSLASAPQPLREIPFILPDNDEKVRRALATFDRNPTVDGHKIGVIYVAQGQSAEATILANSSGSPAYTNFVDELGTLIQLKNATFNTGGLDRSEDIDGQYAYCWRDRSTEVVWHVTTMMPTNIEADPQCINKKRHVGNDYVNIIWNDSGQPFNFDTFPSQFNYVYIVIVPEPSASFTSQRRMLNEKDESKDSPFVKPVDAVGTTPVATAIAHEQFNISTSKACYRVQVQSAPGFPSISPAAETKLISSEALGPFVRLLALNASYFSSVWAARDGGELISPWRNRLREILRLRERYGVVAAANDAVASVAAANASANAAPTTSPSSSAAAGRGASPITGPVITGNSSIHSTNSGGIGGSSGLIGGGAGRSAAAQRSNLSPGD